MDPRISFVTLGVRDIERATAFYRDVLRLPRRETPPGISFFEMGPTWLALYPRDLLAADAGVPAAGNGFAGFTLSHNVRTQPEVDRLLAEVEAGGGTVVKAGHQTSWGGYAGYFSDSEGYLWEVAWNPRFPHV